MTFWLVVQRLNQLHHRVPPQQLLHHKKNKFVETETY